MTGQGRAGQAGTQTDGQLDVIITMICFIEQTAFSLKL